MSRTKLNKFAELATLPNVIEGRVDMRGRWRSQCFKNDGTITAELGCGRGDFTLELACRLPQRNFIGIDLKGARLWRGAKAAIAGNLTNVVFLRTSIRYLEEYFNPGEIDEIWLTFPDPFPKRRHAPQRLTAPSFLEIYRKILKPGGLVHFKTDDPGLFDFTLCCFLTGGWQVLETIEDLYGMQSPNDILQIQTKYERQHLAAGRKIRYSQFRIK
jgi:tRNA (guanine-N7-)-methyltransferase